MEACIYESFILHQTALRIFNKTPHTWNVQNKATRQITSRWSDHKTRSHYVKNCISWAIQPMYGKHLTFSPWDLYRQAFDITFLFLYILHGQDSRMRNQCPGKHIIIISVYPAHRDYEQGLEHFSYFSYYSRVDVHKGDNKIVKYNRM